MKSELRKDLQIVAATAILPALSFAVPFLASPELYQIFEYSFYLLGHCTFWYLALKAYKRWPIISWLVFWVIYPIVALAVIPLIGIFLSALPIGMPKQFVETTYMESLRSIPMAMIWWGIYLIPFSFVCSSIAAVLILNRKTKNTERGTAVPAP